MMSGVVWGYVMGVTSCALFIYIHVHTYIHTYLQVASGLLAGTDK